MTAIGNVPTINLAAAQFFDVRGGSDDEPTGSGLAQLHSFKVNHEVSLTESSSRLKIGSLATAKQEACTGSTLSDGNENTA